MLVFFSLITAIMNDYGVCQMKTTGIFEISYKLHTLEGL